MHKPFISANWDIVGCVRVYVEQQQGVTLMDKHTIYTDRGHNHGQG